MPDQPSWDKEAAIWSIMSSCGFATILPYRGSDSTTTSKYILEEAKIASDLGLPCLTIAEGSAWSFPDGLDRSALRLPRDPDHSEPAALESLEARIRDMREDCGRNRPVPTSFFTRLTWMRFLESAIGRSSGAPSGLSPPCPAFSGKTSLSNNGRATRSRRVSAKLIRQSQVTIADLTERPAPGERSGPAAFSLNVCIEAGIAQGAGVPFSLLASGDTRRPPFMLRDKEVKFYKDDAEMIGLLHQDLFSWRRRVINFELESSGIECGSETIGPNSPARLTPLPWLGVSFRSSRKRRTSPWRWVSRNLCFVLMPFGVKSDPTGTTINFDRVYADLIEPAIRAADLDPIRADNEMVGGIIHKPMFERLVLCEYAVADLTMANANVYYELGVRHAVRPWSTVLLYAGATRMPFDVALLRALPYKLSKKGLPTGVKANRTTLIKWLKEVREAKVKTGATADSPLFQLLDGFPDAYRVGQVAHAKTDIFREQVDYSERIKEQLAKARGLAKSDRARGGQAIADIRLRVLTDAQRRAKTDRVRGRQAIADIRAGLGNLSDVETGIIIDLFLSYRAVMAWGEMISLVDQMPKELRETVLVQEQLGLALNRAGRGEEAERVLTSLIERRGPSSETYGILGRVYKDRWETVLKQGDTILAEGFLEQAIDAYLRGFEADWRDAYPGINAVTLMELKQPPDPQRERLLPLVTYATQRRLASGKPDYWDYATLLELAILARDEERAKSAFTKAVSVFRETWELETTARNLRLIREARKQRGEEVVWANEIEQDLDARSKS